MLIQKQVPLPSLPLKDVYMKAWVVPKDGVPEQRSSMEG